MANIIKKNNDNFVPDIKSGFNRMLSDNYAFIGGSYYLDSMDSETRCQVYQVGEPLATVFNGVGVQKRKIYFRVQNTHHKFMRASYMKHFAKFLAILHHNASFFSFCFIINFGIIQNLLHIFEKLSQITLLLTVTAKGSQIFHYFWFNFIANFLLLKCMYA